MEEHRVIKSPELDEIMDIDRCVKEKTKAKIEN